MEKRICPHCQKEIPANLWFCSECGKSLINTPPPPDPPQSETHTASEPTDNMQAIETPSIPTSKKKRSKIILPITMTLLAVIVLAAVLGGKYVLDTYGSFENGLYELFPGIAPQEQIEVTLCSVDSCPFPSAKGGEYCNSHSCMVEGCTSRRLAGGSYCDKHLCQENGCKNRVLSTSGKYCTKHTCVETTCHKQASEGGFCSTHYNDLQKAIADALLAELESSVAQANSDLRFSNLSYTQYTIYSQVNATMTNISNKTYYNVKVRADFYNSAGTIIDSQWTYVVSFEGIAPGASKQFHVNVSNSVINATANVGFVILEWN